MPGNLNALTNEGGPANQGKEFAALVQKIVNEIESVTFVGEDTYFGRLIYLASLRDNSTGRYYHEGIRVRYSNKEAMHEALSLCHENCFSGFLKLSLEEQTQEVREVLESHGGLTKDLIKTWRRLRPFEILHPERCHPVEQDLFSRNMDIILKVLRAHTKAILTQESSSLLQ